MRSNEKSNVQLVAAEKLQKEGKVLYKKGSYNAAIEKFTEAINMQPPILMSLLDNRSAIYEKQNELKLALADAKTMTQKERTNPRGYLRAGKILHLMNKSDTAIELYRYGLKHVEPSDPYIGLLQQMLEKAAKKQEQQQTEAEVKSKFDPLMMLPLELVEMIMDHLLFHNIVALQRVSKGWNRVISSNHTFWKVLDFSKAKAPVKKASLLSCIRKSKREITKAIINRIQGFDDRILIDMATGCRELSYLRIMNGFIGTSLEHVTGIATNLRTLILNCQISLTALKKLINPDSQIEHLECWRLAPFPTVQSPWVGEICPSFRRILINFENPDAISMRRNVRVKELLDILPNVVEFQVCGVIWGQIPFDLSNHLALEVCVFRNSEISAHQAEFPVSLRHLDFCDTTFRLIGEVEWVSETELPRLEILSLRQSNFPSQALFSILDPVRNSLKRLQVSSSKEIGLNILSEAYFRHQHLSLLEELSLEADPDCSNTSLRVLHYLPSLEKLDLSLTSVTGGGVLQFINNTKSQIKEITVNGCDTISSDLIQYAGAKNIKIIQLPVRTFQLQRKKWWKGFAAV